MLEQRLQRLLLFAARRRRLLLAAVAALPDLHGGAVLYPLLVYVGISTWYWGLLTLGLYSLGIALPMLAIALGFFKVRLSLSRRLGFNRGLRLASGAMLAGIGILILSG